MNVNHKHVVIVVAALIAAVGLSACGSTAKPLTQAPTTTSSAEAPAPEAPAPAEQPAPEPAPEEPAAKATSCDIAREAILTGTPAGITKAMKGLVADKKADATAREYARYYTGRDKGNKQMQEMDVSLIQMACA